MTLSIAVMVDIDEHHHVEFQAKLLSFDFGYSSLDASELGNVLILVSFVLTLVYIVIL